MKKSLFILILLICSLLAGAQSGQAIPTPAPKAYGITAQNNTIILKAGILERTIRIEKTAVRAGQLRIDGTNVLDPSSQEMNIAFYAANPDAKPVGIKPGDQKANSVETSTANLTDVLKLKEGQGFVKQTTQWNLLAQTSSATWTTVFDHLNYTINVPRKGVTRLTLRVRTVNDGPLQGVFINQIYEVYDGFPAIRKWVEVCNNGPHWLKIDNLVFDDIVFAPGSNRASDLTPGERGAAACLRSFQNNEGTKGVITGSEIPSALRSMADKGGMGYAADFFEWVLGPTEKFMSEPVFLYAFSGTVQKTISGVSTPLDRAVERDFQRFLQEVTGVLPSAIDNHVPLWCSWSNVGPRMNDKYIRDMADVASRAGFKCLQVDAGWSLSDKPANWSTSTSEPDPAKFPQFLATTNYVRDKGLQLGLWVSCYRNPKLASDLTVLPDGMSLPITEREGGLAMSFTSPWRYYFTNELVYLHDYYGATYFKQDLTNIKFGDIAATHDSRTHKESLLRGLRGILESASLLRQTAPDVVSQLTHEIYWGTPGVPCDLAALKNANTFHIPPNDYSGTWHHAKPFSPNGNYNVDSLRQKLIEGCFHARDRFYAHRGLPLYAIEYYGAATFNFNGSLTEKIQQRQLCSWLLGAPSVYAGDLNSLTPENISTYRRNFDLIAQLHRTYGIYNHFQYSGVPIPTDTDWHWWGKLNEQRTGIVVVMRGKEGETSRAINIPWADPAKRYRVTAKLSVKTLGNFTGKDLIAGKLTLSLDAYGQDILELASL
jgi:hypothetical protein